MHVLVVEDDTAMAGLLAKQLNRWGHSAEIATTCSEALKKTRLFPFNLILLDLFLPDGLGYHLLPDFKQLAPAAAVIAMTGHNTRDLEQEVRRLGVLFYMIKPFDSRHLEAILSYIAHDKETGGQARTFVN